MTDLLSKDHTILERPFMEFRPFGVDERGEKIRDVSGAIVSAYLSCLEERLAETKGRILSNQSALEMSRLLNERIRDPAYHVAPEDLKNFWRSYSYEFLCYVREFCFQLLDEPEFVQYVGQQQAISPPIAILARSFPVSEVYKMWPHFGEKYVKGCIEYGVGAVTDRSAVLRMKYTERALQQVGPYRKRCAGFACQYVKAGLASIPVRIHGLPSAAEAKDRTCVVNGDEWCEWEFTWSSAGHDGVFRSVRRWIAQVLLRLGSMAGP